MKTKMTVPYRNAWWAALGYCLTIVILGPLAVVLVVKAQQYVGSLICVLCALVLLKGSWKRFNYGMRINEKRIVLLSWREKKVVPYDAVSEVVVTFTQEKVVANLKMKEGEDIRFVWKEIITDTTKRFPSFGWGYKSSAIVRIGVNMSDRFVAKSTERLSLCDKVRVEDLRSSYLQFNV